MGDKLTLSYKKAFLHVLRKIKSEWLPKYILWMDAEQGGLYD